jgi:hypothetical protein
MESYTCPTCNQPVERDLLVFMKHTDAHIMAEMRKTHPEKVFEEGVCGPCSEHFKQSLGKRFVEKV